MEWMEPYFFISYVSAPFEFTDDMRLLMLLQLLFQVELHLTHLAVKHGPKRDTEI